MVRPTGSGLYTWLTKRDAETGPIGGASELGIVTGKDAFFPFLYLEVLDASFSLDGVSGAFAITRDPFIIALGFDFIAAISVRSRSTSSVWAPCRIMSA